MLTDQSLADAVLRLGRIAHYDDVTALQSDRKTFGHFLQKWGKYYGRFRPKIIPIGIDDQHTGTDTTITNLINPFSVFKFT